MLIAYALQRADGGELDAYVTCRVHSYQNQLLFQVLFHTQDTSAKTTSGRCRRGHLEK